MLHEIPKALIVRPEYVGAVISFGIHIFNQAAIKTIKTSTLIIVMSQDTSHLGGFDSLKKVAPE